MAGIMDQAALEPVEEQNTVFSSVLRTGAVDQGLDIAVGR